jgi:hypothetical protein
MLNKELKCSTKLLRKIGRVNVPLVLDPGDVICGFLVRIKDKGIERGKACTKNPSLNGVNKSSKENEWNSTIKRM